MGELRRHRSNMRTAVREEANEVFIWNQASFALDYDQRIHAELHPIRLVVRRVQGEVEETSNVTCLAERIEISVLHLTKALSAVYAVHART